LLDVRLQFPCFGINDLEFFLDSEGEDVVWRDHIRNKR
jgi:hypothetical protein